MCPSPNSYTPSHFTIHKYDASITAFGNQFFLQQVCFILDNGLSGKTEFAVLFSLSTGLVLLLAILILVLYCRRQGIKKSQEELNQTTKTQSVTEQSTTTPGNLMLFL